jgi:hypothetical protein
VRIAANLHADTLEEARKQIVEQNGVDEAGFRAFGMFLPVLLRRGPEGVGRRIGEVTVVALIPNSG